MKLNGDWGCGDGSSCGTSNTQKWGPDSIYNIACKKCGTEVEFFKDEKKHKCPECGEIIFNEQIEQDSGKCC